MERAAGWQLVAGQQRHATD